VPLVAGVAADGQGRSRERWLAGHQDGAQALTAACGPDRRRSAAHPIGKGGSHSRQPGLRRPRSGDDPERIRPGSLRRRAR